MVSNWQIQQAARVVRNGGVIAYPTEAVWGLGCDPWHDEAVERDIEQFDFLLEDLPEIWLARLAGSWPGPNTWLVPHQNRLPEWISGQHDSVALRVSDHPQVRALCRLTGPLVSTSANPAGRPSARSRLRVEQYFPGQLDAVLGGALGGRKNPSLIRDLISGDVIRPS